MELDPREYQEDIYQSIIDNGNTLVVLPTGLGKTLIALMVMEEKVEEGKCLFLTPTKPLAKQHCDSIKEITNIDNEEVELITGDIRPEKREYKSNVVVSTPQTIKNDIESRKLDTNFSFTVFDECHRATGDYAYNYIADKLDGLMIGLTASPGGKKKKVKEVIENLGIENIEIRTEKDKDVKKYVKKRQRKWIKVKLTKEYREMQKKLGEKINQYKNKLEGMGFKPKTKKKREFLELKDEIMEAEDKTKYPALIIYYTLMHLLHMKELIETQGSYAFQQYVKKLEKKDSKSAKKVLRENRDIIEISKDAKDHPKLRTLVKRIKKEYRGKDDDKKIIIFVQYRSQISYIVKRLKEEGIEAKQFVGKTKGVTREEQKQTIDEFREGEIKVLVASSIGEEGLDIPSVDKVFFYEPIPSEIRTIQRRGRTARLRKGKVVILIGKNTKDEGYYYASRTKERKMKKILYSLKENGQDNQKKLSEF